MLEALWLTHRQPRPHKILGRYQPVALLGLLPKGIKGRAQKYLLQILLTTATKRITVKWLKSDPPTYDMWIEKNKRYIKLKKVTYSLRLPKGVFTKGWSRFIGTILTGGSPPYVLYPIYINLMSFIYFSFIPFFLHLIAYFSIIILFSCLSL